MTLNEKNQLFIDCITHWQVDGVEQFEAGHNPEGGGWYERWDNGDEFKLNGDNCPLCIEFDDDCILCLLSKDGLQCIREFDEFLKNSNIETCKSVIERLWNEGRGEM